MAASETPDQMQERPAPGPSRDRADPLIDGRRRVMALCADAAPAELRLVLDALAYAGLVEDLRRAETGLVMVRGRIGGDGDPFNFGEATVTRSAVRLESGEVGFGYQLGRDAQKTRDAAILDALTQHRRYGSAVESAMRDIRARLDDERATRERRTAATRVNFFTMVRGEDE